MDDNSIRSIISSFIGKKRMMTLLDCSFLNSELKKEREVLELAMTPFLQAEHDIAFTLQRRAFLKKVEELMKNEPDFNAYEKFYNSSSRFLYPVYIAQLRHLTGTGVLEKEKQFYDKAKQPAQQ